MDWQQLPAVKGSKGFQYKLSIIHMSTRIKYSEIHSDCSTRLLADFLQRAVGRLPPFYIVFTDNAMAFTMKFTPYPNRKTQFTKMSENLDIIHALIAKGKPWRNGIIERSNRTDKEAVFDRLCFLDEEERRYQLRLFEMYYNRHRPHQGLNMQTPESRARQQHFCRTANITLS